MPFDNSAASQIFDSIASFRSWIISIWWLWMFPILFLLARSLWLAYIREWYRRDIPWTMLELKIPREVKRSPRAMEQILTSIHSLRNSPGNIKEKWWDGETTQWFSLELASFGGELRFFMRLPQRHRSMVEAGLYAHYPDIELVEIPEAEDYIHRMPATSAELLKKYKMYASELILLKDDVYPIRTYVDFEESEEDYRLDPIATILETIGKIAPQEQVWIQILIRAKTDNSWKDAGEKEIEDLKEKSTIRTVSPEFGTFEMTRLFPGFGIAELIKAIDKNIAKPAFDTVIRYIYISPPELYSSNYGQRAVTAAYNQHASEAVNRFDYNRGAATRADIYHFPHLFPKKRVRLRQRRIYANYRERRMYPGTFVENALGTKTSFFTFDAWRRQKSRVVLNTEEVATLFHLPTKEVMSGQLIRKVEARKMGPPMGLAIYGEEGEELPGLKK